MKVRAIAAAAWILGIALASDRAAFSQGPEAREPSRVRVAVVPVIVAAGERPSASSIFEAVAAAARFRFDLELMTEEQTFVAGTTDLSDRVLDCGPDARCIAGELKALDARLAMVVVANLDLAPPLIGLQLIDCDQARVIAEAIDRPERNTQLGDAVRVRAGELFDRAGHELLGRLVVRTEPPGAAVQVSEGMTSDRLAANAYHLRPGKYWVRASMENYRESSREVEVAAGEEVVLDLVLEKNAPIWESPWLWIAAGLGVAAGVTAILIATQSTDTYVCVPFKDVNCEP